MEIDEEYIDKVKSFIEQKDAENVKALLIDLHPADIAELCNDLAPEEARFVYRLLDNETAADVLVEMDEDVRKEFLELLPSETIAKRFVDYMDTDDAVDLMRDLDEEKKEEVLSHIEDIEQAGDIVDLLKYDEDTAGGLMGTEMVTVNENWSMPECLKEMRLQAEQLDEIYYVYVIDDDERLQGVFPLKKMITSPSVSKVKHVMRKDPISVHVDTPTDEVVQIIEKYDGMANDNLLLPVPTYMTACKNIKKIIGLCGIEKEITWHTSRHTMATEICLTNGVPIETLSKMLGHTNIRTTQIYAKITHEKESRDMAALSDKLSKIEQFNGITI